MTYVITDACIDVKDGTCLEVCPVDCIYEGGRTLYIQPDECIDCGLCVTVCPVQAIYEDADVPAAEAGLHRGQRRILRRRRHRLGRPGGVTSDRVSTLDVPLVKGFRPTEFLRLPPTCRRPMLGADADLHDARLVDPGHADILEDAVVDLALLRRLDHNRRGASDQRPEGRGLRLLGGIAVEGEVDAGVGEIGAAAGIGDPESPRSPTSPRYPSAPR